MGASSMAGLFCVFSFEVLATFGRFLWRTERGGSVPDVHDITGLIHGHCCRGGCLLYVFRVFLLLSSLYYRIHIHSSHHLSYHNMCHNIFYQVTANDWKTNHLGVVFIDPNDPL